ncbi:MAG: SRPBCC family protein [Thiohalocapsa sp.]|uniref:SRPBCC family protein n=1 Tax=Thiohalocapsa sp. TaxID=2497641 RepID=UPI0025FC8E84|nr:SRPBCC family protein [Thiohalocapsa sp.]MCG6942697.1 SRPBCC family protein [Thiohalocapsa sp.]
MLYLILFPLVVIAGLLVFLAIQPGEVRVRRSLVMRCTPEAAFDLVRDLGRWPDWSPRLLHEPDAERTSSDAPDAAGGWYAWNGQLIGAGRVTQVALHPPERIERRIAFQRPFKFKGAVTWEFAATAQDGTPATEVFWIMRGRMPFLLRFLAPMFSQFVDKDFELGLVRLRALLDPAAPKLNIRFPGAAELPAQSALTLPFEGGMDDMIRAMEAGFPRLAGVLAARGIEPAGPPFTAYHMAHPKADRFRCDIAIPVPPDTAPGELTLKHFAGGLFEVTEVQGSYDFMALAWHTATGHLRMAKRQWDRARPALEIYATGPDRAASDDALLTRICVPVKAKG